MARAGKLKVYRTPIGFHDAYVAATSRKAALQAWGSDADLFARGIAEQVDDPVLTQEPLARPGVVIKRSRGSAAEQFAALPPDRPRSKRVPEAAPKPAMRSRPGRKAKPRPSRSALDATERAIADADRDYAIKRAEISAEERRLADARRTLDATHERESARLQSRCDKQRSAYEHAIKAWREG